MVIQWYPGHMAKAKRQMQSDIKLVDLVIELLDARLPLSSRNPDIDTLAAGKLRMVILNKYDLADEAANLKWKKYFNDKGIVTVAQDSRSAKMKKPVMDAIMKAAEAKFEKDRKKGILKRPVRVMVCGIPNVGKSTLINSIAGRACTKVGNKPGVTKGNQWIRLNDKVELLDTPGILWPKFEDEKVGLNLAFVGSINDEILERYELSSKLIDRLKEIKPGVLCDRYGIEENKPAYELLNDIGINKKLLKKGGEADMEKSCRMLIDDFRSGRLGRITLEYCDNSLS